MLGRTGTGRLVTWNSANCATWLYNARCAHDAEESAEARASVGMFEDGSCVVAGLAHQEPTERMVKALVSGRLFDAFRQDRTIGGGKTFDPSKLSPEMKEAIEQGIGDAWADFGGLVKRLDAGKVTSGDVFGTRAYLKNNYLYRMGAAVMGIYGNSNQEAMYPVYPSMPLGKS